MKSNREFIDGIYEKARMLQEEQAHNSQDEKSIIVKGESLFRRKGFVKTFRSGVVVMAVAAMAVVLLPHMITKQGNHVADSNGEYSIEPVNYGLEYQRRGVIEAINGEGILVDSYSSNEGYYYLVKTIEGKELDSVPIYIVLYDNGGNSNQLEKNLIGMNISFSYVEEPISLLANIQEDLNKQFDQDVSLVYQVNSLQIKE
ncbi:hypothetical protein [Anaerosporobacter sp.]